MDFAKGFSTGGTGVAFRAYDHDFGKLWTPDEGKRFTSSTDLQLAIPVKGPGLSRDKGTIKCRW
jgi:hypothetical protein